MIWYICIVDLTLSITILLAHSILICEQALFMRAAQQCPVDQWAETPKWISQ